ncbi:hypothetical protein GCM10009554_37120 [Kribbella koreensis]|uniref:Uncharacterized protein n=1 Tax=Kribbella koreensis TaxID=57909 RepID=A0ABN1QL28_9ACTN
MAGRPWVLVDIDGVLNPEKNQAERGFTPYRLKGEEYLVWLHPEHGRMLNELDREGLVDLRWGTTWNDAANRMVGPAIGLDRRWEFVNIDRAAAGPVRFGHNWKAVSVREGVGDQAFAWLDDAITEPDRLWAEDRVLDEGIPTLLMPIDRNVGLQPAHLDEVRHWAQSVSEPSPVSAEQLLRRTPDLAADPVAVARAEWLARTVAALPDTVAAGNGVVSRSELALSVWDRTGHAVTAEYKASGGGRPVDDFVRQSLRRYGRGQGDAAVAWADRAALRASAPHAGHVRPVGPHEHRLVLPAQPGREHGYQVQALIDSAAAVIGTNPEWQRVQKSVQVGADGPTMLVNLRADRKTTSTGLTLAFGNAGAVERPYEELLRGGPEAALEAVRTATDYEIEPLQQVVQGAQADAQGLRLSPLTDPALLPPGAARPGTTVRAENSRWTGTTGQQNTTRTME